VLWSQLLGLFQINEVARYFSVFLFVRAIGYRKVINYFLRFYVCIWGFWGGIKIDRYPVDQPLLTFAKLTNRE
jgi:hypothetical protein